MIDLILVALFFGIGGLLVLAGFLIWTFRDVILYGVEVVAYLLQAMGKVIVQGAVALLGVVDEWFEDLEIAADPLLRALVIGGVGFLIGIGLVILLATILRQSWVIVTLTVAVALGVAVGLIADPEKDWSLGAFPSFPWRDRGGPELPLNL